ncbi:hypothetical protein B0T26DRAFT_643714 [Lasiosphaeria miniovina]|uniref:DUF221-domain-containing protein n=1 Tax=Lasiosphaeria miniovina TaxID=1954250 RepID=A0AA40AUM4_9PEZI|nr:uncharacterized protein B0T26DRAFT_643714 [Lasiosphaeria miniovina]KAK0722261.1 hypothetical protein B0T26DRAFT_643714 [Lasiosphaeria miniovina]
MSTSSSATSTSSSSSSSASPTVNPQTNSTITDPNDPSVGSALQQSGISLVAFATALVASFVIFGVQMSFFLLLRNILPRIYKPKTYLVPERETTQSPPSSNWALVFALMKFEDREVIKKCGLDAYFFLRYLKTLLVIFVPIAFVVIPILVPLNFIGGLGQDVIDNSTAINKTTAVGAYVANVPKGLDTLAWGNISPKNQFRRWAHLGLALCVIFWVCFVFFVELRVYIKIRQDYLTSPEHRLRASANTVLLTSIPDKWCTDEALRGLFDVFPGGIENIWLARDYGPLLEKIRERELIHQQLEEAETELIRAAKRAHIKQEEATAHAGESKDQKLKRERAEDEQAGALARQSEGLSAGDHEEVPHLRERAKANAALVAAQKTRGAFKGVRGNIQAAGTSRSFQAADQSVRRNGSNASSRSGSTAQTLDEKTGYGTSWGNTTRKVSSMEEMINPKKTRWFQFWRAPTGSLLPPKPQEKEVDPEEVAAEAAEKGKKVEYPEATTVDWKTINEDSGPNRAAWAEFLKPSDRPTHGIPLVPFLPALPFLSKSVDTIYYCRAELARLNLEIEEDQKHEYRFPKLNTAFIQFRHQVAAHMACQAVTHHLPGHMAPRMLEISPNDVIWDNMSIKWWDGWTRRIIVFAMVGAMIILWAFPVAWTASLSNFDALVKKYSWLHFLEANKAVANAAKAVAGVLPAIILAILLALVPQLLDFLAGFQGSKTGSQKSEVVQVYYFIFLFVQVFLVVSITTGTFQTIANVGTNLTSTPTILAVNLPKAANYFFSYMILQALSTSSGTLLQIGTLVVYFVISRLSDSTARAKWQRQTNLPSVTWGSFFPVYTNFACIGLIYSIVAPIISIFAIITFSLLWVANRYNMLYVTRFRTDTGGVLYPRAINQTFTGLYVMELCLIGLFSLAQDEEGRNACLPQAFIMLGALIFTAIYQYLLNTAFGPLFLYLPVTVEDEAELRGNMFQEEQDKQIQRGQQELLDRKVRREKGDDGRDQFGKIARSDTLDTLGSVADDPDSSQVAEYMRKQKKRNGEKKRKYIELEAQQAIGKALWGGFADEIEDLLPAERAVLVREAFKHSALRARRPTVWIPRDDLGVSDDEIRRTRDFSKHIWITNKGTALDSKARVVYGCNPPDFSEADIILL